jgi:carbon monoxide dehydrogenase subunit G
MRFSNTIQIAAAPDEVFDALVDLERIASALPGAELTRVDDENFAGAVRLSVGPVRVHYEGRVQLLSVDHDARRLVLEASGGDAKGRGQAKATVTAVVGGGETHATIELTTELEVRGRLAQVGQTALAGVSQRMLGQFARNLERELGGASAAPADGTWSVAEWSAAEWQRLAIACAGTFVLLSFLFPGRRRKG